MTHLLVEFTLQIAIILLVAKIFGELFERMGQSSVLGELIAGMVIGPYALGSVNLPFFGKLFPIAEQVGEHVATLPVSPELYVFAQIGAVILLFLVGLETDAKMFMKYGVKALGIAIGGVVLPFFLGAWATMMFGFANSLFEPTAMFMGAIMVATSVGITARVLSDIYKLDTSEGVSILAAAVIDDILGILVLALVISMGHGGDISLGELGMIGLKAVGFIGILVFLGFLFIKKLSNFLLKFQGKTYVAVAAALCFLIAALAEMFGLAMIIGAYLTGIIFSVTKIGHEIEEKLVWTAHVIVPVFFAVMGMLVDFKAMLAGLVFGLVITVFAIIGKIVGCGLPALFSGFNFLGSLRIGFGMLPRGEVALIVAGVGLAAGIINQEVFGVSIMMTIITTLMAPLILVPLFKIDKSGLKQAAGEVSTTQTLVEPYFNWSNTEEALNLFQDNLVLAFKEAGYDVLRSESEDRVMGLAHAENRDKLVTIRREDKELFMDCSKSSVEEAKQVILQAQNKAVALVSGFAS